jgi:hypothetical protein
MKKVAEKWIALHSLLCEERFLSGSCKVHAACKAILFYLSPFLFSLASGHHVHAPESWRRLRLNRINLLVRFFYLTQWIGSVLCMEPIQWTFWCAFDTHSAWSNKHTIHLPAKIIPCSFCISEMVVVPIQNCLHYPIIAQHHQIFYNLTTCTL